MFFWGGDNALICSSVCLGRLEDWLAIDLFCACRNATGALRGTIAIRPLRKIAVRRADITVEGGGGKGGGVGWGEGMNGPAAAIEG